MLLAVELRRSRSTWPTMHWRPRIDGTANPHRCKSAPW